jgi:hypothetical protein
MAGAHEDAQGEELTAAAPEGASASTSLASRSAAAWASLRAGDVDASWPGPASPANITKLWSET